MVYHFHNPSDMQIRTYLEESETIAIVGLSNRIETAAYMVANVLKEVGYRIIPVNPKLVGQELLGEIVYPNLQSIPFSIDIVDVFRRSEFLPEVARDFIKADAKIFWTQLGLENQEAEEILRSAGCQAIVMNRCIKLDYQQLMEAKK